MSKSIYCELCDELEFKTLSVLEHIHYCNKYNKELKSERFTDTITMRDELCVYKCEECILK